jgi:hypothetical protein
VFFAVNAILICGVLVEARLHLDSFSGDRIMLLRMVGNENMAPVIQFK